MLLPKAKRSCRPFFTLLLSMPECTYAVLVDTMLNNITAGHRFKILNEQGAKEDEFLNASAELHRDISPLANGTSGELQVLLLLDCICLYSDVAIKGPLPPFVIIVEKGKKETTRQQKDENTICKKIRLYQGAETVAEHNYGRMSVSIIS